MSQRAPPLSGADVADVTHETSMRRQSLVNSRPADRGPRTCRRRVLHSRCLAAEGPSMKQKGRDRNAIRAYRRLATRHDPSLSRGRSAAAVLGGPSRRGGRAGFAGSRRGRRVRRGGRRRLRAQPVGAAGDQSVAGSHARHRDCGLPVAGQPRSAGRVVGVHQCAVQGRMPGQRDGARQRRHSRGPARPADRRSAMAIQSADDRPGCRRARRLAGRRGHPGARCPRRRRRARPRSRPSPR